MRAKTNDSEAFPGDKAMNGQAIPATQLADSTTKQSRIRRFGIVDMLVLTATFALGIQLQTRLGYDFVLASIPTDFRSGLLLVAGLICLGGISLSLASIYWLIEQKRTTGKFFREPGHWILASAACVPLLMVAIFLLFPASEKATGNEFSSTHFLDEGLFTFLSIRPCLIVLTSIFLCAGLPQSRKHWQFVLLCLICSALVTALTFHGVPNQLTSLTLNPWESDSPEAFFNLTTAFRCLAALALIFAVMIDRYRGISRDWLHWAGVLLIFCFVVLSPFIGNLVYFIDELLGPGLQLPAGVGA